MEEKITAAYDAYTPSWNIYVAGDLTGENLFEMFTAGWKLAAKDMRKRCEQVCDKKAAELQADAEVEEGTVAGAGLLLATLAVENCAIDIAALDDRNGVGETSEKDRASSEEI